MRIDSTSGAGVTLDDWPSLSDELLQGLVHALNNRVAALSAFVELARLGDDEADFLTELPAEIAQLHRVNGLFGLLPARGGNAEALELSLVLDDALKLHEHHPRLRSEPVAIISEGTMIPVRAPRWALLRALLLLVHAAKREGESVRGRGGASLRVGGESDELTVSLSTRGEPSPYLSKLARLCGGTIGREGDDLVLRLPSVVALRRRERESPGSAEDVSG
jgi:hypothetical protein